jgi:hypothetical protein
MWYCPTTVPVSNVWVLRTNHSLDGWLDEANGGARIWNILGCRDASFYCMMMEEKKEVQQKF